MMKFSGIEHWATIPSGFRNRLDELSKHEYWGDSFANGEGSFFLVQKENGKHIAIYTFGNAETYGLKVGDSMPLFHTQTFAKTYTTVVGFIKNTTDTSIFGIKTSVPTWTLK